MRQKEKIAWAFCFCFFILPAASIAQDEAEAVPATGMDSEQNQASPAVAAEGDADSADSITEAEKSTAEPSQSDTTELQKIEVTGSHIKRTDMEGPSPIVVLSREDLLASGASTVSAALRGLTLNNGVTFDEKYTSSFSPGSASFNLRGLGEDTTLVLVNGRRLPKYSFASELTDSFVDLNSIPLGAVERIEILTDGASAVYGSDAIAGVVNIILRDNIEGHDTNVQYNTSAQGDASETLLGYATGMQGDKTRFTFVFNYLNREELGLADRKFSENGDHTDKAGGADFTSPTFPQANVLDENGDMLAFNGFYNFNQDFSMIPATERLGAFADFNYEINSELDFVIELMTSRVNTDFNFSPADVWGFEDGVVVPAGQAFNTFTDDLGNPIDVYPYWRMSELGRRTINTETNSYRLVTGLEGVTENWDWDVGLNISRSESKVSGENYVNRQALITAIENDQINPFGTSANSATALNSIRTKLSRDGTSELSGIDAKGATEIFEMEAGPVGVAIGGGRYEESLSDQPKGDLAAGEILGQGSTSSEGERDFSVLFAEFSVPVMEELEMQLAARYENYSDFGSTTNPKLALRYQPMSQLVFRGSWGTGFRAPSLAEMYLGESVDLPFLVDDVRCAATGSADACNPSQYPVVYSGNPDLKPEKSTSFNLGTVVEPIKDLFFSLDYFNIRHTDVIDNNAQLIIDNEGNFPDQIIRDPSRSTGAGDPGPVEVVFGDYINIAEQRVTGLDFDVRFGWSLTGMGEFYFKETVTQLLSFERKVSRTQAFEDLEGTYRFPKRRSTTTFGWGMGAYTASLSAKYIDSYKDQYYGRVSPLTGEVDRHKVDSNLTFDLQMGYKVTKDGLLTLGIVNLTDEDPPFANGEVEGYDYATHDPRGRVYNLKLNYLF